MKQGSSLLRTSGGPDVVVPEGRRPRAVPEQTPLWLPCHLWQLDGDRVEAQRPPDCDTRCTKRPPGRRASALLRLALSAPTKHSKRVGGCAGALLSGTSPSRIGEKPQREVAEFCMHIRHQLQFVSLLSSSPSWSTLDSVHIASDEALTTPWNGGQPAQLTSAIITAYCFS